VAGNLFDDALEQLAPGATSRRRINARPTSSTISSRRTRPRRSRCARRARSAADTDPDRAVKVQQLATKTGLPQDVVDRNYEDLAKRQFVDDLPYRQVQEQTPALAQWAETPTNAAIAHDDMEKLGALEWLLTAPQRAVSQALNAQGYGALRTASLFRPLTRDEQDQLASYRYHQSLDGSLGTEGHWFRGALTGSIKLGTQLASTAPVYGLAGALGGAIIGGVAGSVVPGAGTVSGALALGKLGFEAGNVYGLGKMAFQQEAGNSYDHYLEFKDDTGTPIDPEVAKMAALATGAINAGLMTVGGHLVRASLGKAGEKLFGKATVSAIDQALKVPRVRAALLTAAKEYGTTLGEGTALMVGMKAVNILSGELAKSASLGEPDYGYGPRYNQGQPGGAPKGLGYLGPLQRPDGAVMSEYSIGVTINGQQVEVPSIVPTLTREEVQSLLTAPDGTPPSPAIVAKATAFATQRLAAGKDVFARTGEQQPLYPDLGRAATPNAPRSTFTHITPGQAGHELLQAAIEGVQSFALPGALGPALSFAHEAQRAIRAQHGPQFFEALGDATRDSKTFQRLPEAAQAFVAAATKDGPIETLYAPLEPNPKTGQVGWRQYWQSKGIDPAEMAARVTGRPDALAEAERTGGDLAIPTARYASILAPTEHNAFFSQELRLGPDEMNGHDSRAFAEQLKTAAREPTEPSSEDQVADAVAQSLENAGVPRETARTYAQMHASTFGSMARRAGVDPLEWFQRYGLSITRPDLKTPEGGQAPPETPPAAGGAPGEGAPPTLPLGAATGAAVPFLITRAMERDLLERGHSQADINKMTPAEAHAALAGGPERLPAAFGPNAFAGQELRTADRRTAAGESPTGEERRIADRRDLSGRDAAMAGGTFETSTKQAVVDAANRMRAENPKIDQQAATMRTAGEQAHAERKSRPRSSELLTTSEQAAQTEAANEANAPELSPTRAAARDSGEPAGHRVAPSYPRISESPRQRAERTAAHYDDLFSSVLADARSVDPTVDDGELRAEFDRRVEIYDDLKSLYRESGHDPKTLLQDIAARGGLFEKEGGLAGELRDLKEGTKFGSVGGVAKVFRGGRDVDSRGKAIAGLSLDEMLTSLQQEPQYAWLENTNQLLDAIDEVARHGLEADALPGTDTLRSDLNINTDGPWWRDSWRSGPADLVSGDGFDLGASEILEPDGPVDTSFNIDEFHQSLFDELEAPDAAADTLTAERGATDVLDTGEQQPRLPGAGTVRDANIATPTVADVPFALTSEIARPRARKKGEPPPLSPEYQQALEASRTAGAAFTEATRRYRAREIGDADYLAAREAHDAAEAAFDAAHAKEQQRGSGTTLFQSAPLTPEHVEAWVNEVLQRAGKDLASFDVRLTNAGDLNLVHLAVSRGAQRAGLGSSVLRELTRFADLNGRRITLDVGHRGGAWGTTSRSRLVEFYKRFGFVENTGRHADFTLSASMYREPTLPTPGRTLEQPFFHGSPHDFERFSLQHVGSGEGASAYGHGLYFAENPAVAADYHDRLSEGRDVVKMKIGSLAFSAPDFNYGRRAHVNTIENIRASLAEDMLANALETNAAGAAGFQAAVLKRLDEKIADYEQSGNYEEGVRAGKRLRAELEKPGAVSVEFTPTTGGVYQVDIPDEHLAKMLDWDKPLSEQPENVQQALADIAPDHYKPGADDYDANERGEMIYNRLARILEKEVTINSAVGSYSGFQASQEAASTALREHGVPGLRYLDQGSRDAGEGTRNVVVFDDAIVTLTHKDGTPFTPSERKEFFQRGDTSLEQAIKRNPDGSFSIPVTTVRGAIRFGPDRQFSIELLQRADLSTFLHESGHFFLEVFTDLADKVAGIDLEQRTEQQQQLLADHRGLMDFLTDEDKPEGERFSTKQHEKFARAFEAYLMEGKAPSLELQGAFARFRAWLVGVYKNLTALKVELTPEVRGILDRMVASDRAIQEAEAERGVSQMFTTPEAAGMTPEEFALYRATVADASRTARETLDRKLFTEAQRERTRDYEEKRAAMRAQVEAETFQKREYRALAAMRRGLQPDGSPIVDGLTTEPMRLSRKILEDRYGAARVKRLPRDIVRRDGGLDPDVVAHNFGFSSGDELLTAVENAPPSRAVIEAETNQRMVAQHGNLLLDGSIRDVAKGAISNEDRDTVIRAEMRALGRLRRTVQPFVDVEHQAGEARVGALEEQLRQQRAERDYERRWFEAEARLRIAIAEGRKQAEIDELRATANDLRARARGGAETIRAGIPSAALLRDVARQRIAETPIRELKPQVFWSSSRRAAQQAIDRAARQDFDGAIVAKQQELINLNLYREAERALEDVQTRTRFAEDLGSDAARARLGKAGGSYLEQVDGILERFDFSKQTKKAVTKRAALRDWVAGLESQGLPVDLPEELLNESYRRHYSELPLNEFLGITDGLKQIVHLAQLKNRLLKIADKRELDVMANAIGDSIRANHTGGPPNIERDRRASGERARTFGDLIAAHRKMASLARELDGFKDGGPMTEAVIWPLNEASAREASMNAAATRKFGDIIEEAYPGGREKRQLYDKVFVPAIGKSLSKMERLMIAFNWGNDGNRDRVRASEGWRDDQVSAILNTLDDRDARFLQNVFDAINDYWPEIAAKQERVYGIAPEKVDARPFFVGGVEIPGGYFPIKRDDRLDATAAGNLDYEAGNLAKLAAYANATTQRGHTKARLETAPRTPLRRDFGVIFEHVGQVIHDLAFHEALIDVGRVLGHRAVQSAIYDTKGDIIYRQFKTGVRDTAFGDIPGRNAFERSLNNLRAGATVAGLGWSLTTAMLHFSGSLPKGIVRIGPEYMARGLLRWTRDAVSMENTASWIDTRSEMMRTRGLTQQRELNEIRNAVGVNTGKFSSWISDIVDKTTFGLASKQGLVDSYFYLVQQMQKAVDIPTWLGAYEKAMDAGELEPRAIAMADQAVLDAFGGGQVKDLAAVQRGGPMMRLWTNFYSPFNATFNLSAESLARTKWSSPGSVGRLAVDYLMLYTLPATLGYAIHHAARGAGLYDDAKDVAAELVRANLAYMADTMVGVRELSGVIQGYYGYEGPAGASIFADVSRLWQQSETAAKKLKAGDEHPFDEAFWRSLNDVGGIVFHYPSNQVGRTLSGLQALEEGRTSNPMVLITGPPPKNQK
jgi:ribosomal protein S18 acetylase RimI-like enzyme